MTSSNLSTSLVVCATCLSFIFGTVSSSLAQPRVVSGPTTTWSLEGRPVELTCVVEGVPAPTVTWYKDGKRVVTSNDEQGALLTQTALNSLMIATMRSSDEGEYRCKATNRYGSDDSEPASLRLATLDDQFREEPRDQMVEEGEAVRLSCRPPNGQPSPSVAWLRNGSYINLDQTPGVSIDSGGHLNFRSVRVHHSGSYVCEARNNFNRRKTKPAKLVVVGFLERPEDVTVDTGARVTFKCRVNGADDDVRINWSKQGGRIDRIRGHTDASSGNLHIGNVDVADDGVYVCHVQHGVHEIKTQARLSVRVKPSFVASSQDKRVSVGRDVSFLCRVAGSQPLARFWQLPDEDVANMYPGEKSKRFIVLEDMTLIVLDVKRSDEGLYRCRAYNDAGEGLATAKLSVSSDSAVEDDLDPEAQHWLKRKKEPNVQLPPVIQLPPQNFTTAPHSQVRLWCDSYSKARRTWMKNGVEVTRSHRKQVMNSGALRINEVRSSDAGVYTCVLESDAGSDSASAVLTVSDSSRGEKVEVSSLPAQPGKPEVTEILDQSVRLRWEAPLNHDSVPVSHYTVYYYPLHQGNQGWRQAVSREQRSVVVAGLVPGGTYVFLIRANNDLGVGEASAVSEVIQMSGGNHVSSELKDPELSLVRSKLSGHVVQLDRPQVLTASSMMLTWKVEKSAHNFIQGFIVQYRLRSKTQWQEERIKTSASRMHVLHGLAANSQYSVRVRAFYDRVETQSSSSQQALTSEAVPSGKPENVHAERLSANSLRVTWSHPPPNTWNSQRRQAYTVYVIGRDEVHNITVNASVTSVVFDDLTSGTRYSARVAAVNVKGEGAPASTGYLPPLDKEEGLQPWLLGALIGGVGGSLWITLCGLGLWLCYRRRHREKSAKAAGMPDQFVPKQPLHNALMNTGGSSLPYENSSDSGYMHGPSAGSLRYCKLEGSPSLQLVPGSGVASLPAMPSEIPAYASASVVSPPYSGHNSYGRSMMYDSVQQPTNYRPGEISIDSALEHEHCVALQCPHPSQLNRHPISSVGVAHATNSLTSASHSPAPQLGDLLPPPPCHPPPGVPYNAPDSFSYSIIPQPVSMHPRASPALNSQADPYNVASQNFQDCYSRVPTSHPYMLDHITEQHNVSHSLPASHTSCQQSLPASHTSCQQSQPHARVRPTSCVSADSSTAARLSGVCHSPAVSTLYAADSSIAGWGSDASDHCIDSSRLPSSAQCLNNRNYGAQDSSGSSVEDVDVQKHKKQRSRRTRGRDARAMRDVRKITKVDEDDKLRPLLHTNCTDPVI